MVLDLFEWLINNNFPYALQYGPYIMVYQLSDLY